MRRQKRRDQTKIHFCSQEQRPSELYAVPLQKIVLQQEQNVAKVLHDVEF